MTNSFVQPIHSDLKTSLEGSSHLLTLSAKNANALQELVQSYQIFLNDASLSLGDICFTANTKRSHFNHRLAITAQSLPQAQEKLQSFLNSQPAKGVIGGQIPLQNKSDGTVFLFTGQGSQYPNMGRGLYDTQPTFRTIIDQCDEILRPLLDRSLLSVLYPDSPNSPELHQTAYTQPALFALEYALAQLWHSWGIVPDAVMGHSVGEYAAAAVAGVFSLEEGLKLIAKRASLIQSLPQNGMMAAVFTSESAIAQTIADQEVEVDIATVNGSSNVVISGLKESVQKILAIFQSQGIVAKPLQVSHAFHSSLMQPILASFAEVAETVNYNRPQMPMISNLTGQLFTTGEVPNTAYWCDHLRGAVRFSTGMDTLYQQGYRTFIEMGPNSTLLYMGQKCLTEAEGLWLSSLKRGQNDSSVILGSLGKLYVEGREIDWLALDRHQQRRPVRLPNYPFKRQRFPLKVTSNSTPRPKTSKITTAKTAEDLELFYKWQWYCETLPNSHKLSTGKILIFGDRQTLNSSVEQAFTGQPEQFFWVMPGETFQQQENQFILNPDSAQDYERLISTIKADGHNLAGIIHHWNSRHINQLDAVNICDRVLAESAYSIMFLGQALLKHFPQTAIPLLLTTYNAYAVTENSLQGVHQCLGATFNQILNLENPCLKTKVVDVIPTEISPEQLTQLWANELQTETNAEGIVAIRGQQRFVRGLEAIQSLTPQFGDRHLQNDDTYLITGGTSAVALELIKSLLVQVRLNLVLTGRQPLPPQAEWMQCLEEKHPLSDRIYAIQELEKLGATVIYEAVDVTNRASMQELMAKVKLRFPCLDGVIHGAGIFDHQTVKLAQKQPHSVAQVLASKVQGTVILDEITRSQPLKFFVLISSATASKKEWGENSSDYAAANAFLDHYAIYRSGQPSPGRSLAVNFSLWQDLGIAKGLANMGSEALVWAAKARGLAPLKPQQGANAFWQALSNNSPTVTHIINRLKTPETPKTEPVAEMETTLQTEVSHPDLKLLFEKTLCQHITLDSEELAGDLTFQELGLDSLSAIEFIQQLNHVLDTQLSVTLLFEHQSPNKLLNYLEQQMATSPAVPAEATPTPAVSQATAKVQDIAIIGMACKVPGANNLNEYWDLLKSGRSGISDVPSSRWSSQDYFDETGEAADRTYCQQGGFIDNPFDFDPLFFGISPREARVMDPQQRLFLELAWQAIQQSGYGGSHRPKDIGVFVGCGQNNYVEHFVNSQYHGALRRRLDTSTWFEELDQGARDSLLNMLSEVLKPSEILSETAAGNELNEIAARVSHSLDLTGASLAVNTACSSSLVALHLACENLRSGQSSMTIVGGVNLNLTPTPLTFLSRVQALSPTANCYPFDERANGMVIGEGAGALVLKPLEQAVADGDYIHAVIKGSAINNDGHSQGMTAPKPQGQAAAVRQAYAQSGIDPNTVSYIEAHGTGTLLGDPIEIAGMTQAFRTYTEANQFCAVGSVKSSIGHCLSASGIISLIKVVLSMQHGMIPGTKGFKNPNPQIDFAQTPFYVVGEEGMPWQQEDEPLRAGVNGFGFGGTNGHVILEQAPSLPEATTKSNSANLFLLTARNQKALQTVVIQMRSHLLNHPEQELDRVAFTLNNAQREFPDKIAFTVEDRQQLLDYLTAIANNTEADVYRGRANPQRSPKLSIFLDGSSLLTPEATQILAQQFPCFQQAYQDCQTAWMDYSLSDRNTTDKLTGKAHIFAANYALLNWLISLEIQPTSLIAEDMGILVAACASGRLTLEEAIAALARLSGEKIVIPGKTPADAEVNHNYWHCPLITPKGVFKQNATLSSLQASTLVQSSGSFNGDLQTAIAQGGICLSLSNIRDGENTALTWISTKIERSPVKSLLTLMAQLYVVGVHFNSSQLYPQGIRRVLLPSYPFERKSYRAVAEVDTEAVSRAAVKPEITPISSDLLPTQQLPSLSPEQRHASYLALKQATKRLN